jgi:hypothetical protein
MSDVGCRMLIIGCWMSDYEKTHPLPFEGMRGVT